ncbi:MAG: FtsX-like permease family protein [Gammaproteobacteria bacterium]|nr:FtsX-like permease family protein [Gammaproteobacteria bacterium]MBT4462109.1 FtsX-like permease family protein [Gammaproteobacteria bacterium]MBT5116518.1 FtsX-like permease family protein [Gammaproteobacteria bacterium]MBT5761547.1 FtsX-like permease family protein [Gammaproteobacteria bacterium]MBT6331390.1 FtsX-like permease family protein [Gammaproteobacteria bacterium]
MRLLLAYRFLRSKHNSSFINIISKISVLGIILGISILITVISVMNGFEHELKEKVLGFTSHVTAFKSQDNSSNSLEEFENLKLKKHILGYSPYIEKEILLSSESGTANAFFRAVNPMLEKDVGMIHKNMIFGSYTQLNDDKNNILIGSGIASKLAVNVGDVIEVYAYFKSNNSTKLFPFKENYFVVGVFDAGIYEYNNAYTFINLNSFLNNLKNNNKNHITFDSIRIRLQNPLNAFSFATIFNKNQDKYYAQDWSYTHQALFTAISNEKRVMFIILMLIVAIAAFNIISSLLMLVMSKEKEISILLVLGAKQRDIILIFLYQGLILGMIGIVFGVVFGILLSSNIDAVILFIESLFNINLMPVEIYHLSKIPSIIDYNNILFIIIYTFILTLISAIYPALKASGINPATIFRGNN